MKLLITVGEVPIGTKITKKTGEKIYEIRDKIFVYGGEGCSNHPELKVSPGTRLLVAVDPRYSFSVEAVPATLEIVWEVDKNTLRNFLSEREEFDED